MYKQLKIYNPNKLKVENTEGRELNDNEILIEVRASGICGTDIHIYEGSYIGNYPVVPGHEFSGIVLETGKAVQRIKTGDHVAVEPNIACDNCMYCLNNKQNFCENWQATGVTLPGGMAQYVIVQEKTVFNIGELSFKEGAFMEPLSCVIHGIEKIDIAIAQKILIIGSGPIGLLLMQTVLNKGASEVYVVEINKTRAEYAEKFGASKIYYSLESLKDNFFDIVIDATGVPFVMQKTIQYAKFGGKVLLFGVPPFGKTIEFDASQIFRKGLQISSSFTSVRNSLQALDLMKNNIINVNELVSHELPLDEFESGLKLIKDKNTHTMKIIILPNGDV